MPARLLHALRLVAHLARRALSREPVDYADEHVAQTLRSAVRRRVVRRLLDERVEARREREWSRAIERLLAQGGEHEAHAFAGAGNVGAVGEEA